MQRARRKFRDDKDWRSDTNVVNARSHELTTDYLTLLQTKRRGGAKCPGRWVAYEPCFGLSFADVATVELTWSCSGHRPSLMPVSREKHGPDGLRTIRCPRGAGSSAVGISPRSPVKTTRVSTGSSRPAAAPPLSAVDCRSWARAMADAWLATPFTGSRPWEETGCDPARAPLRGDDFDIVAMVPR